MNSEKKLDICKIPLYAKHKGKIVKFSGYTPFDVNSFLSFTKDQSMSERNKINKKRLTLIYS